MAEQTRQVRSHQHFGIEAEHRQGDVIITEPGVDAVNALQLRQRRIICLVADWHRIAFDEAARNTLRQTVSDVGGVCVAVSDEQAPGNSRDVAMRRLRASGKQIGPGTTLVRHDGATA
ncbi:hypothetical protein ACFQ10_38310 [Streptomyces indonesiensis]